MSKTMMTVIIPAYNSEQYVEQAITSVLTYQGNDLEVVVVNDGSTDQTKEICETIQGKDRRVKVFSIPNSGVSVARNKGISVANGKYLTFLDADDVVVEETWLELLQNIKSAEYEFYIYSYQIYDENLKLRRRVSPVSTKLPQKDEIYRSFITSTYMNFCWGKIYLTDFIRANKVMFPEGIKVGEDVKFQLSLLEYHPQVCYIDKDLVKYRQLSTSVMHVFTLSRFDDMAEDLSTRKQLMNQIELKAHERETMYEDVGRNTLSYIKQASKFKQEEQRIELIQKIEDQAVQEVLENIPVEQLPITMRVVVFLLRRKRYSLLLKILSYL